MPREKSTPRGPQNLEPVWIKMVGVLRGILSLDKARRGRESRFTTDEQRRPGPKGPQSGGGSSQARRSRSYLIPLIEPATPGGFHPNRFLG
jgi:hypothetical protein